MGHYADIAVYGEDGRLELLAEAKVKRRASQDWAAKFRRNMYAHGQLPRVPYFLLALPDRFYLWIDLPDPVATVEPQYSADAAPILQPYLERAGTSSQVISGSGLELALSAWLEGLTRNYDRSQREDALWLSQSGLFKAIRGGRVEVQALV